MTSIRAMDSERQGLRELSRQVLGEAQAEARQTLEDARARAESVRQEAERQSEVTCREILERARRQVDPLRSQALASAQLEAQRLRLDSREQLLAQVFSGAREKFEMVVSAPDYRDILHGLIQEAVASLGTEEIILHADRGTQRYLDDAYLAEVGGQLGVTLRRGEVLGEETGIVAETSNGHRRYRNTLEARLERMREALRTPVYRLLVGEAL